MNDQHISRIARELGLKGGQVRAAAKLLSEGKTIPFIARYRKEATGGLDEVAIASIRDLLEKYIELDRRRDSILKSLLERGELTPDLEKRILAAETLSVLEDLYLPFKPKRRTRATVAREQGLLPLADLIFEQGGIDPRAEAARFVDSEKGVGSVEEALAGARDIIAERVSEDPEARSKMRNLFLSQGTLRSKSSSGLEGEGSKYRDYADWSEPLSKAPSHRVMAMLRGKKEGFLVLHVEPLMERASAILESLFLRGRVPPPGRSVSGRGWLQEASSSIDGEGEPLRREGAGRGEGDRVFAKTSESFSWSRPWRKTVLAVDPGLGPAARWWSSIGRGLWLQKTSYFPTRPKKRSGRRPRR